MDSDFVFTFTVPGPPTDAGALIDITFVDEPVRKVAKAVVTKLLTDGEMAKYEDGRTALYLATEHRGAVQALLDDMPAADRQRLLDVLAGTVFAPTLEGFVLKRWASRGFMMDVRAVFRIPELREHLPATPSQAFLDQFRAAWMVLQDQSPDSAAHTLFDLVVRVDRDMPRTPSGNQVQWDEYLVRCRSDPQTLSLARELSTAIQDTSVALFRALRGACPPYLPRRPAGTSGDGDELNVMDCADIADYCWFLCCLARKMTRVGPKTGNEMTGVAATAVARSVIEALLLAFLQRRFPAMAVSEHADFEGSQQPSTEELERERRHLERKRSLFLQTQSLLTSFREAAQMLPPLFVRGEAVRSGPLAEEMLTALEHAVRQWINLRMLSDQIMLPRRSAPLADPSSVFLHPLPDLSMLRWQEKPTHPQAPSGRTSSITMTCCKHRLDTVLISSAGSYYPHHDKGVGADIVVHAPSGGACLSAGYVPINKFLHPEDPASIVAAYLARQAGRDVWNIMQLLEIFDVEQQIREAAADVPCLVFLECRRVVRRRLLFWRKRIQHYVYLVMERRDAVRFGIRARVRTLPRREQELLRNVFGHHPEDPVCLKLAADDDSDGGGDDEEPPEPPPPEPEELEEQEDAPTGDKVLVG